VLELLFDDTPLGVVASCLRGCVMARPGHVLVVADLRQIEARVIAWLAGEIDVLNVFASGQDVYTWTAARVGSKDRQLGKVMVLALGFGMGVPKFIRTALKYGIRVDPVLADQLVYGWRADNPNIVDFWWDLGNAALRIAAAGDGYRIPVGYVELRRQRQAMVIVLPSGRELFYQRVGCEWVDTPNGTRRPQLIYEGINQYTRRWETLRAWPGKIAENITQAVARDVLVGALRAVSDYGVRVIGTVHDELIAEAHPATADYTLALMRNVMCQTPRWARGLPLAAAGWIGERYCKPAG
jgi:DNA polymerase